jgi:transposase
VLEIPKYIIWEILKKAGIKLQVHKTWCSSTDPNFLEKFVDITGLYHIAQEQKDEDGPVILSCDEKSSIQSKQKNLGYVKTSSGKIVNGEESTYKRHGVVNLLSALEVATGKVHSKTYPRKRRIEFLKFMDHTVSKYPDDKEIHIILDNYGVHKNCDEWLNNHPNVTFHFTPTSASWLNLVEVFFCILTRKVLRGASFSSTKDLERRIKCFIKAYNKKCRPYVYRSREIKGSQLKNTLKNLVN